MSDANANDQKKQYSIVRYSRIRDMTTLRHVSNHNTRAVVSENVKRDGPTPVELLADGDPDITIAARRRAKELGLDLPAAIRDGKVIAVEAFMGASPEFFERATREEVEEWYRSSTAFMQRRFGRALISVMKHEDEKTPHLQAVALAAVEKKAGVKGRPPKDPERRRLHDEKVAAMPVRWTFSYNDLLGGAAARLSHEQDDYNACVRHLGLARGERQKEVGDLVLDNGVVVAAARISRGKRQDGTDRPARHFTTQEYQAETRRDRAKSAQQQRHAEAALARAGQHEQAAEADRRAAAAELAEAARLRMEQEAEIARQRRELHDLRVAAAAERDAAERHRVELDAARIAMIASRDQAATDAVAAAGKRAEADATAEQARLDAQTAAVAASAERAAITEARRKIDENRRHDEALLALLVRAADDDAGLNLRLAGERFAIGPNGLNDEDHAIKAKGWSKPLMAMARSLAMALDRIRTVAKQLHDRERAVAKRAADTVERETKLAQERTAHDIRLVEHQRAIADLDRREAALAADEDRVVEVAAAAEAQRTAAVAAQTRADATLRDHLRWLGVIDTLEAQPDWVDVGPGGALVLQGHAAAASPALAKAFETAPPDWVVSLSVQRLDLADALQRAEHRERGAAYAAERLEAMIAKAGPVLTPAQHDVANEATRTARQFRPKPDGWER